MKNHIKELELYNKIIESLGTGNISIGSVRPGREHQSITVSLEVNSIKELKYIIIPIMHDRLKTLKFLDFNMWSHLVDIYYNGYHLLPEGIVVFNKIKLTMNKYRLINSQNLSPVEQLSIKDEINSAITELYNIDSPYTIKKGVRYLRATDNLVSDTNNIIVRLVEDNNIKTIYYNISDCSRQLNIGKKQIKNCLVTGKPYNGYTFNFI